MTTKGGEVEKGERGQRYRVRYIRSDHQGRGGAEVSSEVHKE